MAKKLRAFLSRVVKRQAGGDDTGIDYSNIPRLTSEQLVAARIDREVCDWLLQFGKGTRPGSTASCVR